MKFFIIFLISLCSLVATAEWHQNVEGGFGFEVPEGWSVEQDDKLSFLDGPGKGVAQSHLLMGTDWIGNLHNLKDLKKELQGKYPKLKLKAVSISGVSGFEVQVKNNYTEVYMLREPTIVMLLRYVIRGSASQLSDGRKVLASIKIQK